MRARVAGLAVDAPVVLCGSTLAGADIRVGGESLPAGTPVLGAPGLGVELRADGRTTPLHVAHVPDPSRPDSERLRELAPLVDAPLKAILAESPVALSAGDAARLPREEELAERFEQLAEVCAEPRAQLTRREDVVALQRARRIGARGATWLGSHPAAWAGRRGRGPIPERVLAEQPHSLVDIYENRVAATLVDVIDAHLRERIRALGQQRASFKEREMASEGSWRMRERVSKLWAESWHGAADLDAASAAVAGLLEELHGRRRKICALRRRPGYAEVAPRHRHVRSLVVTNIFRADDRYHAVARLWRSFGRAEPRTSAEQVRLQLATLRGHEAFVRLLVHRAVDAGLAGPLLDPLGEASEPIIEWGPEHVALVRAPDVPSLEVVPMFCAAAPSEVGDVLEAPDRDVLVVLQPSGDAASATVWRHPEGRLSVVAESPTHLGAVESIGALVRGHVLGARYAALPPGVELSEDLIFELRRAGVRLAEADASARGPVRELRLLDPVDDALLEHARDLWLPVQLRGAQRMSRARLWEQASARLVDATRAYERARPCPTPMCGGTGRLEAERDRVVLSCSGCHGCWGMQRCPQGHAVAFALAGDDATLLEALEADVDRAVSLLGLQLVQPIGVREGRFGALCRVCGAWTMLPLVAKEG